MRESEVMITFAEVEQLKKDLTDRYVVVQDGIPELRRFQGRTGFIKTVNMSGRALVQFDGSEDIAWYDIEPTYLKVVTAPPAKSTEKKGTDAPAAEKVTATEKTPAAAKPAGKSPLEMARAQGAAGATKPAAAKAAETPVVAAGTQKKLSPLELARQQGAAGSAPAKPAAASAAPAAEKPAAVQPAPTAAASGKKLSPLELARQQGAAGSGPKTATPPPAKAAAPAPAEVAKPVAAPTPAPSVKPASSSGVSVKTPATTAEILALARQQGAVK